MAWVIAYLLCCFNAVNLCGVQAQLLQLSMLSLLLLLKPFFFGVCVLVACVTSLQIPNKVKELQTFCEWRY